MKTKYSEAAEAIQNWIAKQKLSPGDSLPSSRSIAKIIGSSEDATERACTILRTAGIITRTGNKLNVGSVLPPLLHSEILVYVVSYQNEGFLKAAKEFLNERGIANHELLLTFTKNKYPATELRKIFAKKPTGVILWLPDWMDELKTILESTEIPVVLCADGIPSDINLTCCGSDLYRGVEKSIRYLYELGHRNIAHLVRNKNHAHERAIANYYQKVCLQWGLKQSAKNIWIPKSQDDLLVEENFIKQRKLHPEVTALFGISDALTLISSHLEPNELTMVGLYKPSIQGKIPLISPGPIVNNGISMIQWTCNEIISEIRNLQSGRPKLPLRQALFAPNILTNHSSRPDKTEPSSLKKSTHTEPYRIPAWESWCKTYAFLEKAPPHWNPLDLSKIANRSMTQERSWLGKDPLLHFSPGLRSVHEIPFTVIDAKNNEGHSVVTFRSPHTHLSKGTPLPISVQIPVNQCAKAFYFLHACGWVKWQEPFAKYIIHFKNGKIVKIPLIPIGHQRKNKLTLRFKPNIQDWWRTHEALDFPHAMYATVYNPAVPQEYERLLYTLEWINPHPKDEIDCIKVQVDPKAGPTLALIAITALI